MTSERFPNRAPPRRVWALVKAGRALECEIKEHVKGHEVRIYLEASCITAGMTWRGQKRRRRRPH